MAALRAISGDSVQDDESPALLFEYSDEGVARVLDRGHTRSDRCERHRKTHRQAIQALAVPYIDLSVIGEVPDPQNPTGPLGGLGPLPLLHKRTKVAIDLSSFEFGMTDEDVLRMLDGLRDKQVAVIEAGTGTGKSTFMPFRLMSPPDGAGHKLTELGPIVVTQPRRAAAKGLARFVGEELCLGHNSRTCGAHIGPGFRVGYQVSREKVWDGACQLLYVTDGTMINWVRDGQLARIGVVIVDEAHERSENIDLILAQLREAVKHHKHLRIIITSATLDGRFFVEYFGGPDKVFHLAIPATKSFGFGVPLFVGANIDDAVLSKGLLLEGSSIASPLQFDGWARWGPEQDGYPPEDLHETTRQLQALRCVNLIPIDDWKREMPAAVAAQVTAIAEGTEWGDILAFLPTSETIDDAVSRIGENLSRRGVRERFDVYPLLATTERALSDKATASRQRGDKRRIVVSSNLAETSLTVKGVRYVVDSGLICQPEWDSRLAKESYPTKAHSQSGVRQRWGRVGRDSPGWVFPLYSVEQFLSLPRNTPPGSAQTNLESFYIKLIAAGLEPERAVFPADFRHENVVYDDEAQRVAETFSKESERARRALVHAGAVDNDGHLTDYGRDLERFPGTGSEALALMLSEQLACVHEVALALEVLGQGDLMGKSESAILRIDHQWPASWRVCAAQRHRALAIGCEDDLDLLLRVVSIWQKASTPSQWCAQWWVNEVALNAAWAATMTIVGDLSAAMKGEATRQILPALGRRARGVLARTMAGLRYTRVEGMTFRAVSDESDNPETVQISRGQLVDAGDEILAFNRFRIPSNNKNERGRALVSHLVRLNGERISTASFGSDDIGLELILTGPERLGEEGHLEPPVDPVSELRERLPVGSVVELRFHEGDSGQVIRTAFANTVHSPTPCPIRINVRGGIRYADPSFSRDWDPLESSAAADTPLEEALTAVLDPRDLECNDETDDESSQGADIANEADADRSSSLASLCNVESAWSAFPLSDNTRASVVGYRVHEATVVVVVESLAAKAAAGPWRHADLYFGQETAVRACGIVRDHEWEFLQCVRPDGSGYFYIDAATPGLSFFDRSWLARLSPGSWFAAVAIPGELNTTTITLLPGLRRELESATVEIQSLDGLPTNYYSARVEETSQYGRVVIGVGVGEAERGVSHRFQLRQSDLRAGNVTRDSVGSHLLVAFQPDYMNRQTIGMGKRAASASSLAKIHGDRLRLDGDRALLTYGPGLEDAVRDLTKLDNSHSWQRSVWECYASTLRCSIRHIRPQLVRKTVTCPPVLLSLLHARAEDIQRACQCELHPTADGEVEIVAPDLQVSEAGAAFLAKLGDLPRALIVLPRDLAAQIFAERGEESLLVDVPVSSGGGRTVRKRVQKAPGLLWIWVDNGQVGFIGETASAVEDSIELVRDSTDRCLGELIVPAGKNGLLIGKAGATINRIKETTGCTANNADRGMVWMIEGPSEASVKQFFALASAIVGGSSRILETKELKVVDKHLLKERRKRIQAGEPDSHTELRGKKVATKGAVKRKSTKHSVAEAPAKEASSGCFVATVCYADAGHPDVILFKLWRDSVLKESGLGRVFVAAYYHLAPAISVWLGAMPRLAATIRVVVLRPIARILRGLLRSADLHD